MSRNYPHPVKSAPTGALESVRSRPIDNRFPQQPQVFATIMRFAARESGRVAATRLPSIRFPDAPHRIRRVSNTSVMAESRETKFSEQALREFQELTT